MEETEQPSHRRGPWSATEDNVLIDLINRHGPLNWVQISSVITTRTPKQCRERYHQNLKPSLNHDPITPEEGREIERLVELHGKRWAEIARQMNGRSDNAVKNWWNGNQNRRKRNNRRRGGEAREQRQSPYSRRPSSSRQSQSPSPYLGHAPHPHTRHSIPLPPLTTSYPGMSSHRYSHGGPSEQPLPSPCSSESTESELGSHYTISPTRSSFSAPQPVELPPLRGYPPQPSAQSSQLPSLSTLAAAPTSHLPAPTALPLRRQSLPHHYQQQQNYYPQGSYAPLQEDTRAPYTHGYETVQRRDQLLTAPNSPQSRMYTNPPKKEGSRRNQDSRMKLDSLLTPGK